MAVYEVSRTYKSIRVIEAESKQDALEIADELWGMDDDYTFEEISMFSSLKQAWYGPMRLRRTTRAKLIAGSMWKDKSHAGQPA